MNNVVIQDKKHSGKKPMPWIIQRNKKSTAKQTKKKEMKDSKSFEQA